MTTDPKVALKEYKATVLEQRQALNLGHAGVDPALYPAGQAELAIVGNECFRAIAAAGRPLDGFIHTESRFRQTEALPVDQVIAARGKIEGFADTPRGTRVHYRFDLQSPNKPAPSVIIDIIGLQAGEGQMKREPKPPSDKPPVDPFLGYKVFSKHQLAPGAVDRYSRYVGNRVHFDPLFANKLGFAMPVTQGLMVVTMMLAALAKGGPIKSLDMTVKFVRPCFWTDEVVVWTREKAPGIVAGIKASTTSSGKPIAEASIAAIGR